MLKTRMVTALSLAAVCFLGTGRSARGQNITSGSIAGTVTDETGAPIEGAQVQVRDNSTGVITRATTRDAGRYLVQGLEVGGPYSVTVRRIGFAPLAKDGLRVTLSQITRADFNLTRQAATLTAVQVRGATANAVISAAKTGAGTTISDSSLRRLPTLNRNFADFVSLVPQVSTTTGYLSGGGVNLRQNAIQIDGAAAGDLFGLGTTGQPGSQANAKSIPLESVKQYQVLLSPFDVRQGNFGGLLINAVTQSGTNEFHGSAYGYSQTQNLERSQPYLNRFLKQQYGFSLGGPIIKDHLFFFVNPEHEKYQTPAGGSYIGSPDQYVSQASIDQFNNVLTNTYGLASGGTGAQVQKLNPKTNIFARVDAYLPLNTRLVLRHNYASANNISFGRGAATSANPSFALTSNQYGFSDKTNSSVAEFLTNLPNGVFNELLLNLTRTTDIRSVPVHYPQITVRGIPRIDGSTGTAQFIAGTEASSQGNSLDQRTFEITDNFTFPVGDHHITIGTKDQFYHPINLFGQNSLGSWTFNSLDSLNRGLASNYVVSAPSPTDPAHGIASFHAALYAYYIEDVWAATPTLNVTMGARWDKPNFQQTPPLTQAVLDQYGRNTSVVPTRGQFSPRVAFNWDVTGDQRNQIRGGIGYFSGPPPFVYLSNAFGNSGSSGFVALTCNGSALTANSKTSFLIPQFNAANIGSPPTTCASGTFGGNTIPGATITGPSAGSAVNTIDPHFRFPQYQKISAAYDHRFSNGLVSTVEGLYTKAIVNAFYQNLALTGPTGILDYRGRILYGNLTATGGTPNTLGSRTQVLDLTNTHGDYSYSLTGTLQKSFSDRFEGSLSYSYMQARDVASITSSTAGSNYRYQRDITGSLNDMSLTRAKNEQPHHIVATGTYSFKTKTNISFIYQGSSGAPFDYVYGSGSGSGSGDANADGNSQNDLVYVPRDVRDPNEILFTGYNDPTKANAVAAQQAALDKFISGVPCLAQNRGKLLSRNLCHNPWSNDVDVSIAQSLEAFHAQNLTLRLDIIDFGNLLNPKWGRQFYSDQGSTCGSICSATILLTQSGNKLGTVTNGVSSTQGIYTFDTTLRPYSAQNASSNYRMQMSLRYSF
ncbi:MAG: carboxypeptidase regulatory-like domain-containing protein [Gemmatimonadota bacterium]|nr:carboxypeptidase regulatory-like domain-containing protein [Gemmatimonadota bacterium]